MNLGHVVRAYVFKWVIALGCLALLGIACSSDEKADLAQGCLINTDCNTPLVCAFRRCHNACESTRDCPPGLRCVASDRPFHVCQLLEERACTFNSQCPVRQVCASDGQCRDQCQGDADCLQEQTCIAGSCADNKELIDGGLEVVVKDAGPSTGQPCTYNSQCPAGLICRVSGGAGLCQQECLSSIDCTDGRQCVKNRCQAPVCPESDASSGIPCAFSSDCPSPLVCRSGSCACECHQSGDCPSGYECTGNRCSPSSIDAIGAEGGFVTSPDPDHRLTLSVPAGALAVRVHLTIDVAGAWPAGALGPVFEIRPSGTMFAKPVTLVYKYQQTDIAPYAATSIRLGVANGATWTPLPTVVNDAMSTATAEISHLSTYGLIASTGQTGGDASSTDKPGTGGAGGAGSAGTGGSGQGGAARDASAALGDAGVN
jgi:hypothetical protein